MVQDSEDMKNAIAGLSGTFTQAADENNEEKQAEEAVKQLDSDIETFNAAIKDATPEQKKEAAEALNEKLMPTLQQADEHLGIIKFVSATDAQGRDYWAYLNIAPSKHLAFVQAFEKGGQINYLEYGKEIDCGWGKEPDAETKQRMADEFGCQDDFEEQLITAITQPQ